jgi:hypothetical protein
MSLYFDLVINCDLREDTPEDYIQAIRYWTDPNFALDVKPKIAFYKEDNLWDREFWHERFLAPDPEHEITVNFRRKLRYMIPMENNREVYRYVFQYVARWLHDDGFYEEHLTFVAWLATISQNGFMGYYCETDPLGRIRLIYSHNRQVKFTKVDEFPIDFNVQE